MQIHADPLSVCPGPVHMEERCLRQRRQCLVQAVDDNIRSLHISIFREHGMKAEMRAMGFIQDQDASSPVDSVRDPLYI